VSPEGGPPPALEALLGRPRATIVCMLDRPLTAGELAERLGQVPSGITHHLTVLESAGLVARQRDGQSVLVRRTARGAGLLALYTP
jgi:DNA-binding transcriptional ArsR family regulator